MIYSLLKLSLLLSRLQTVFWSRWDSEHAFEKPLNQLLVCVTVLCIGSALEAPLK